MYSEENRPKGVYNGGGKGVGYNHPAYPGSSSGDWATDISAKHNDLFHRIILSGGEVDVTTFKMEVQMMMEVVELEEDSLLKDIGLQVNIKAHI